MPHRPIGLADFAEMALGCAVAPWQREIIKLLEREPPVRFLIILPHRARYRRDHVD